MLQRRAGTVLLCAMCVAAIRGPGKYAGVVVFDRWGGCTLYGGVYLMYVSEAVKEQFRKEAGKCVQIDATEVYQPVNPGDGLIKRFKLLGSAPANKYGPSVQGLKISAAADFKDGHVPRFVIRVENVGDKPITLRTEALAPTILAAKSKGDPRSALCPSDGPSVAVVTRQAFWIDGPRMKSEGTDQSVPFRWWVTSPRKFEERITLQPKGTFEVRVSFKMPAGEYEFLAGYGGGMNSGQCIASNPVAFDAKPDGTATLPKVAGR